MTGWGYGGRGGERGVEQCWLSKTLYKKGRIISYPPWVAQETAAASSALAVDWTVNTRLTLSLVVAQAFPGDGAVQHTGGDKTWSLLMLSGCIRF